MPYRRRPRAGDLRIVSKAQWDKEGLEGFDKRPAGTGSYRYVGRQAGLSIAYERIDNHWSGEKPDFKELEFRHGPRGGDALALLLSGEAHIADLPRELQKDAIKPGHEDLLVLAARWTGCRCIWAASTTCPGTPSSSRTCRGPRRRCGRP